jgi:hypothetical protein
VTTVARIDFLIFSFETQKLILVGVEECEGTFGEIMCGLADSAYIDYFLIPGIKNEILFD